MSVRPPQPPVMPLFPQSCDENKTEKSDNNKPIVDYVEQIDRLLEWERKHRPQLTDTILRCFQPVHPIGQDGPVCGMVALAMGLSLLNTPTQTKDLINTAKMLGWSNEGEMFSCEWMASLARTTGVSAYVSKNGIQSHLGCVINCLKKGGCILVPYDKDSRDWSPFLSEGKHAHWALLTGIICLATSSSMEVICSATSCFEDESIHCSTNLITTGVEWLDEQHNEEGKCVLPYVLAFQGQSAKVALWPFTTLAKSNENLVTVSDKHSWVQLPPGGIIEGLSGKAVFLMSQQSGRLKKI